jgi:hypothetical protein
MRKVMDVYEIYQIEGKGTVLAGTNDELNKLSRQEITNFIGSSIEVCNGNGDCFSVTVGSVEIQNSLIDKKNIFILTPFFLEKDQIKEIKAIYLKE